MFTTRNARRPRRRGMILMVVLALLTLFAIVGISFVLVANSQESSARIARESETQFKPDIDPEAAFAFALGQILYDVKNVDDAGVYSALRGHSLARSMYGWYDATENAPTTDPNKADNTQPVLHDKPFAGVGRLSFPLNRIGRSGTPDENPNDITLVNYMYFRDAKDKNNQPVFNKLRDPERYPMPDNNNNPRFRGSPTSQFDPEAQPYVPMAAVPYTYPDHNNFFLAAINPATGGIACPSFHRGYLFPLSNPNDPLWTDKDKPGILRTVRPITTYHPNFPRPVDGGGDVKNLDGVPGGADSIWIDIGAPVMKGPDGRRYKMLIAPLILDLDGRIDLNVVGNLMGQEEQTKPDRSKETVATHRSNQGWGPWEVNPWKVLDNDRVYPPTNAAPESRPSGKEWRNIFTGLSASGQSRYLGRYDTDTPAPTGNQPDRQRVPLGPALTGAGDGNFVRGWAQVDYNGAKDYSGSTQGFASDPMQLPTPTTNPLLGFPEFDTAATKRGYRNGAPLTNVQSPAWVVPPLTNDPSGTPDENEKHASLYWPYNPRSATATGEKGRNYRFPVKDLVRLLRDGGTGADMIPTDLRGLVKGNLWSGGKRRNLVTLLSADLDRPGATPYVWDRYANGTTANATDSRETRYGLTQNGLTGRWVLGDDSGANNKGIPFPDPKTFRLKMPAPKDSEFDVAVDKNANPPPNKIQINSWRHNLQVKGLAEIRQRINLNRDLPDYPTADANGFLDMDPTPVPTGNNPSARQKAYTDFKAAHDAREKLADDVWKLLRAVTGAGDPDEVAANYTSSSREFHALRALAQIAVNVVDYIDNDDVHAALRIRYTEGGSNKVEWFYGFELPRLVLNEAYVQYDNEDGTIVNDKVDLNNNPDAGYLLNTWVELKNSMVEDRDVHKRANLLDTTARLAKDEGGGVFKPIYRLVLCEAPQTAATDLLRRPDNTLGDPTFNQSSPNASRMADWTTMTVKKTVAPMTATSRFDDPAHLNPTVDHTGFLLVGPSDTFNDPNGATTDPGFKAKYPKMVASNDMRLKIKASSPDADTPRLRVVLQRLANPALPEQDQPTLIDPPSNQNPMGKGYYNPWISVDYIDKLDLNANRFVQKGRLYDVNGKRNDATPMADRVSVGRTQPFAGSNLQLKEAVKPAGGMNTDPTTTFYRQNSTADTAALLLTKNNLPGDANEEKNLKLPFDWLTHLDRKLINPFELWHVSGVAPWLVTQDFVEPQNPADPRNSHPLVKSLPDPDQTKQYYQPRSANQHAAPWGTEKARLYRFFEFVTTGVRGSFSYDTSNNKANYLPQPSPMDRVIGKVNLNAVWNRDVFRALADAQPANSFYDPKTDNSGNLANTDKFVDDVFGRVVASRSQQSYKTDSSTNPTYDYRPDLKPTDTNLASALGLSTKTEDLDRPFWSFAIGHGASAGTNFPNAAEVFAGRKYSDNNTMVTGIQDTLFRGGLLDVPDNDDRTNWPSPSVQARLHPYQKKELLRKIFANLTTRSNVFAVWVTIGFFEVEDENVRPVRLGKEIGKSENRQVRYRLFTLVDRTRMKAFENTNRDDFKTPAFSAGGEREVKLDFSTGNKVKDGRTDREWEVKDDVYLTYEPGADNEETVRVYMKNSKPHALFQRDHGDKCRVLCRGNPGPMSRYNPREDTEVVPFFMLID